MNLREEFWSEPERWPNDTTGFVFLARAVDALGRKLFPDTWNGAEPRCKPYPLLSQFSLLSDQRQRDVAHDLLLKYRPDLDRMPWALLRVSRKQPSFNDEEWAAAREIVDRENLQRNPGWDRFQKVQAHIRELAQAGLLKTSWRRLEGGDFTAISSSAWNTERIGSRFVSCQFNPDKPFDDQILGAGRWIFVDRQSLESCCQLSPPQQDANAAPGKRRIAEAEIQKVFKDYRDSRGGDIPSEKEDIAYMKRFGVSRERVRELRKNASRLPRGRGRSQTRR